MKYRKKPVVVEATQWFRNGDHPEDYAQRNSPAVAESEGKVVRYYRHPQDPGERVCPKCQRTMHVHGWIDTFEGGHIVCPGDWVITGVKGEHHPVKEAIFQATYEPVEKATYEPA